MQSAAFAPLVALPAFVHPFLHHLRFFCATSASLRLGTRRKACNSSHVVVRAAVVRQTQQGIAILFLSFLCCLRCAAAWPKAKNQKHCSCVRTPSHCSRLSASIGWGFAHGSGWGSAPPHTSHFAGVPPNSRHCHSSNSMLL